MTNRRAFLKKLGIAIPTIPLMGMVGCGIPPESEQLTDKKKKPLV